MTNQYSVTGIFYEKHGFQFRKVLNIKKSGTVLSNPDLMIIMMNPGGSQPVNGIYNELVESEAVPDKTQIQLMKLMTNCGFQYARVLNLSDLREAKSKSFFEMIPQMERKKIRHSIFDRKRQSDLETYFIHDIPLVLAWGVNDLLQPLTKLVFDQIKVKTYYGIRKKGSAFGFYHPLPPSYYKQSSWVEQISKQFKADFC